jgi:hypothetical protein
MVLQTEEELKAHLKEQIEFLQRSAEAYDEGFKSEAKRLAVVIRVLLHDAKSSTSLLIQLKKKNIKFYDTAYNYDPKYLTPGLIQIRVSTLNGAQYVPPLDDGSPSRYLKGKIPFDEWWNKIVFADTTGNKFTRKDLILAVCNKDGGAHIDPKLNKAYADLTRFGSLGWQYGLNGIDKGFVTDPELASIRQIAHEVLKSLKDESPEYF